MGKAAAVLVIILLVGCSDPFMLNMKGYSRQSNDLESSWKLVASMKYIPEPIDYWKSPAEFFKDGGGDCEDFAIALMYELGPESSFVGILLRNGNDHAIVQYQGQYLEPQNYGKYYSQGQVDEMLRLSKTYEEVMAIATFVGMKGIE